MIKGPTHQEDIDTLTVYALKTEPQHPWAQNGRTKTGKFMIIVEDFNKALPAIHRNFR